ncbi:Hemin transport protein [Stenotrophomonas lacuserhaii]|uniref:Hemin transport protein n=1 Tax=Stenotrophomonas lacuserhaii TaxID=2760084 RepID=UPI003877DF92
MSRALSAVRATMPRGLPLSPTIRRPTASQLASLGTVLCLYRADSNELAGWQDAVAAHACQGLDSEGVRESLCFTDARGRCCWRLYLLPDSDFLAWDRLVAGLPIRPAGGDDASIGERLWRRLAGSLGGQRWRMCAVQLHAVEQGSGLAASLAPLSSLGSATARRIARLESADGSAEVPALALHA